MTRTNTSAEDEKEKKKNATRRKVASTERAVYMKPLIKLKQQEDMIDRSLVTTIGNMKIESNMFEDILRDQSEISTKRENFLDILYKNLHTIQEELKFVKSITEDTDEMKKLDIEAYKLRILKLSHKIQDFKNFCSIQNLIEEQTILESELKPFESNLQKYEQIPKRIQYKTQSQNKENKTEDFDYNNAQDLYTLVAKTGHTEHWSDEDHLLFLKMRKKCSSIPDLVAAIQTKCPDLTAEVIVHHEAWYKVYVALRQKQKLALREWRNQKELNKLRGIEEEKDDKLFENKQIPDVESKEENTAIYNKVQICKAELTKPKSSLDSERTEKKRLIKQWKIEKESKRSMDEEMKMQIKLKREIQESQRQKRMVKIREALQEYKRKKSIEASSQESNKNSKEKLKCDSTLIVAFRKQDEEYTKRRKDMILRSKKSNNIPIIRRFEFLNERDTTTLFNHTHVWNEKCRRDSSIIKSPKELQYIKDLPKLCMRRRDQVSLNVKSNLVFI